MIKDYELFKELVNESLRVRGSCVLRLEDGFLLDTQSNNRFSFDFIDDVYGDDVESVASMVDSMFESGCICCTDCIDCVNCEDCIDCMGCEGCVGCESCEKCTNCNCCLFCVSSTDLVSEYNLYENKTMC